MSVILVQPQIEALDPLTPAETAFRDIVLPSWKWQAQRRMGPMNTRGTPAANARAMATALPGIKRVRMPFNRCFFGTPEYPGMHPELREWILELVGLGWRFLWVQMDGPSQEGGSGGSFDHYHLMYPTDWPDLQTLDDWRGWMGPNGPAPGKPGRSLSDRHIENFAALIDWIEANAPDMIIDGFEGINEPVSYRRPGATYGPEHDPEFMGYYVAHNLRIFDYVESRMPGKDFYIDGWSYSTDFEKFWTLKLPTYGDKTAMEVFRERIPSGRNGRLVWSAHLYSDWMVTPYSHAAIYREFDRRWSRLVQDRFVITETSTESNGDDWRFNDLFDWNRWFLARVGDWFQDRGAGIGWFTALNYGGGKLMTVFKDGEIFIHSQGSFGSFYDMACRADRTGDLVLAARSGHQPLHRIRAARGLANQPFDPNPGTNDPAGYYTVGFGGLGVCVLTGQNDANNFLYGGPGRSILYGGALDDYLYLGIGGGVARVGPGQGTIGTNGGENLIYTGPNVNLVTCIHGRADIVCDPAGVTRIFGFDPTKGDRLSFKGAFTDANALRAASQVVAAGTTRAADINVEIAPPQGGKVILLHKGNLIDLVPFYVRDFTDGWYGPGWTEPVDYTEAEFSTAMAPIPPIIVLGVVEAPEATGPVDARGLAVIVRDAQGRLVNFRWGA